MKQFLTIVAALCLFSACHHHDDEERVLEHVVMVYIANDNTGGWNIDQRSDIRQMMEGTKNLTRDQKVVTFIDGPNERPYILEIAQGDTMRVHQYNEELSSSDAAVMSDVLAWIEQHYAAESYGLVLWGHATGWEIKEGANYSRQRRAYGDRKSVV